MKAKITKLSTRGQVVIPKELREDLEPGTLFFVSREGDKIVLERIPIEKAIKDFKKLLKKASKVAKKTGLKPIDVARASRKARNELWKQ